LPGNEHLCQNKNIHFTYLYYQLKEANVILFPEQAKVKVKIKVKV